MTGATIGFAGGYTAGHVMPILALAEAWRRSHPQDSLICYGSAKGFEGDYLRSFDLPFQSLPARPEYGAGVTGRLRAYQATAAGLLAGRRDMRRRKLDGLVCFGGYACLGAGLAAASLGRPLAVFEANAVPGRANSLLARFASLKIVAMPEARVFSHWKDAQVMNLPLRVHRVQAVQAHPAALEDRPARLLITGGTFGSDVLNQEGPGLAKLFAKRGRRLDIYHQAGMGKRESVEKAYQAAGLSDGTVKISVSGFDSELHRRWAWADVALCSAGAGTLAEMAASGTAGLVVPQAMVADRHQEANARAMAARRGLIWLAERDWRCEAVADHLEDLLETPRTVRRTETQDLLAAVSMVRAHCLERGRQEGRAA